MQSSTAIAMRALIMLIVLISVPLFAIFGKSLPDVVKGLLDGRGLVLGPAPGTETPSAQNPPAASNPFAQSGPYRAAPEANAATGSLSAPAAPAAMNAGVAAPSAAALSGTPNLLSSPAATSSGAMAGNRLPALPAGNPMGSAPSTIDPMTSRAATAVPPLPSAGGAMPSDGRTMSAGAQPASFLSSPESTPMTPADTMSRDNSGAGFAAGGQSTSPYATNVRPTGEVSAASTVGSDEKFRQAEMRLRELGATHYMLETWGPDNNRYRFVCKMAIGGNAEVNRYFQAIDDTPWQAMDTVLKQVEQWRARPQAQ
jgi:hypothetical protein